MPAAQQRDGGDQVPSWLGSVAEFKSTLAAALLQGLRLAALESQLAGLSLAAMLGLAVVAALLLVSTWLLLLAAAALWLIQRGWTPAGALLLIAGVNLVPVPPALLAARRLSRNLRFDATRRQLGLAAREPMEQTEA